MCRTRKVACRRRWIISSPRTAVWLNRRQSELFAGARHGRPCASQLAYGGTAHNLADRRDKPGDESYHYATLVSFACSTRITNSEIALSVASGASRCGEWRALGNSVTLTGQ